MTRTSSLDILAERSKGLQYWLFERALPLWWERGADREKGGFEELLGLDGNPIPANRRARVQPRQIYCYAAAKQNGWNGPSDEAIAHGLAFFEGRYLGMDGLFVATVSPDGDVVDGSFDLYNQAFALFAYANVALTFADRAFEFEDKALALLSALSRYKHKDAGFEEALPRKLPLCSNPHMHLFEATLALEGASPGGNPIWSQLADEIAELCMGRFIDGQSGGLREFFDGDWQPYPGDAGRIMEPGHQFEWAWLLVRWGKRRNEPDAIAKARRLFAIAIDHGLSADGSVAIMQLNDDFSPRDRVARLWPQTEWIKAGIALASVSGGDERRYYLDQTLRGVDALRKFIDDVPVPGLWRDKLRPDNQWVEEPVPASSFYHIACAILELQSELKKL